MATATTSITHGHSGVVTGTGSNRPPLIVGCRNICGYFCIVQKLSKCKSWFWKSPFWENLGAKLKILAPIISSVGNLQLYVRFLSEIGVLFNPRISCPDKRTTRKNGWRFFVYNYALYITLLRHRACLACSGSVKEGSGGHAPIWDLARF